MRVKNCLLGLIAGLSIANAVDPDIQLIKNEKSQIGTGTHAAIAHPLRRRQGVTSGGFGQIDDVTSGGFGDINGTPVKQQFSSIKGGMLLKDEDQTLCEVALVNQRVGFVAASCLEYSDDKFNVDPSIRYVVMMSQNTKDFYGAQLVESVKVNPSYNPTTYENNIAVLLLQTNTVVQFQNKIADWPSDWNQLYYVHRSLTDSVLKSWNEPYISMSNRSTEVSTNMGACSSASSLFTNNQGDFFCNPSTLTYYYARDCNIPYGAVYGVHDDNVAAAAIFSHTAVYGNGGFCGTGKLINYYVILRNYIKWAEEVSGMSIEVYHSPNAVGYTPSSDPNYSMKLPGGSNDEGVNLYGQFTMESIQDYAGQRGVFSAASVLSDIFASQNSSEDLPETNQSVQASEPVDMLNDPSAVAITKYITDLVEETVVSTEVTTTTATRTITDILSVSETVSITETATSTMVITETTMVTEANDPVTFNTKPSINSGSMINTAQQSFTVTVSVTDTVTETASEEPPTDVELDMLPSAESVLTVTVTVVDSDAHEPDTDLDSLDMAEDTVTVISTIFGDPANSTTTITDTVTEPASVEVVTSYITLTDTKLQTVTSIVPVTVDGHSGITPDSDYVEESSTIDSESDGETSGGISTGVIIAIVLLLLLLLAILLYYFCVYRRKKRALQQQQCGGINPGVAQNRVQRWFMEKMLRRESTISNPPPDYSNIYRPE